MADGDLASIISGTSPTDPAQLRALQGQQIVSAAANPEGWGWGGGLARQLALGQGMNMAQGGVNQATQANLAAQPSLATALANPDPMAYVAQNPTMDPVAQARVVSQYGIPGAREALGAAGLYGAQTQEHLTQAAIGQLNLRAYLNRSAGTGGGGVTPAGRGMVPGPPGTAAPGPGIGDPRFQGGNTPTLPIDPVNVPPAQLPAFLQRLSPAQRAQAIARLRAQYGAEAPAATPPAPATQ
jgi:hypothetical protein